MKKWIYNEHVNFLIINQLFNYLIHLIKSQLFMHQQFNYLIHLYYTRNYVRIVYDERIYMCDLCNYYIVQNCIWRAWTLFDLCICEGSCNSVFHKY
jgi:predicted ABC-type exoprotein transport system permease subunit